MIISAFFINNLLLILSNESISLLKEDTIAQMIQNNSSANERHVNDCIVYKKEIMIVGYFHLK